MFKKFFSISLASLLVLFASVAFAQDATVAGTVNDEAGEALVGANVFLEGTNLGAATDENGSYRFVVAASYVRGQEVKITARFIGYRHKTERVTLNPGNINLDFALAEDVLKMDAIVVTGVVDETPKTKLAFSVASVDQEALEHAPAGSPEAALRGKVAGVKVVRGSGQPGSEASVLLRAPIMINASGRSQDPLYIVDGVIIDPSVSGSPLSDIPTEDIESMEVVKGAAGASLYGSRAANGVVVINTKRGNKLGVGQTKVHVRNEFGFNSLAKQLDLNGSHAFLTASTSYTDAFGRSVTPGDFVDGEGNWVDPRSTSGRLTDNVAWSNDIFFADKPFKWVGTGTNGPGDVFGVVSGDSIAPTLLTEPLDALGRFFDPSDFISNTVSISRNMEKTNFLVSFGNNTESGVIDGIDGFNRKTARINLDHKFGNDLTVGVSTLISQSERDVAGNDNNDGFSGGGANPFFALTFMSPEVDLSLRDERGFYIVAPNPVALEDNPLISLLEYDRLDSRKRILGSITSRWAPTNSFNLEGAFSYDRSDRTGFNFQPKGIPTEGQPGGIPGRMLKGGAIDEALNGSVTAQFSRAFNDLTVRTKAQGLFERTTRESFFGEGEIFATGGIRNIGSTQVQDAGSGESDIRSTGYSLISAFDYKDRYIVDFLVRRDGSSLFGSDERWATYYRASGAYRLSQESWWFLPAFEEFKIRGSYGTAGGRPNFSARFETWSVTGSGQVVKGNLGNKELKPEFSKELELGVDFTFLNRFSVEASYVDVQTEDQLLFAPLPGYAGYNARWINGGTLDSKIWEASLNASLKQTRDFSWTAGFNFDRTRSTLSQIDVPAYSVSYFRIVEGDAFGTFYGDKWVTDVSELNPGLPADEFQVNDDGYLVWVGSGNTYTDGISNELWGTSADFTDSNGNTRNYRWGIPIKAQTLNEDGTINENHPIGDSTPDFNLSFTNTLRWKGLTFYGLLDAQIGGDVYSNTIQWGNRDNQYGETDQAGKPEGMKKPILYYQILYDVNAGNSHYIESGEYLKLRELSLRYKFNRKQLSGLFGGLFQSLTFGVVGRNLLTWSDFRGYDPEVGLSGGSIGSAVVGRVDAFGYPNFRTFSGLLEFEF